MTKHFLFPHKCKWVGLGILIIGILFAIFSDSIENSKVFSVKVKSDSGFANYLNNGKFAMELKKGGSVDFNGKNGFAIQSNDGSVTFSPPTDCSMDFTFTLQILLIVLGGLLFGFSREKNEDEFISSIRLRSLLLAVFVNYLLVIVADLFVYGLDFMIAITYNLYTLLLIHIVIFHVLLWKNSKKEAINEE